jgi:hypothetical protein
MEGRTCRVSRCIHQYNGPDQHPNFVEIGCGYLPETTEQMTSSVAGFTHLGTNSELSGGSSGDREGC